MKHDLPEDVPPEEGIISSLLSRGVPQSAIDRALERGASDDDTVVDLSLKFYFTLRYEETTEDIPELVRVQTRGLSNLPIGKKNPQLLPPPSP